MTSEKEIEKKLEQKVDNILKDLEPEELEQLIQKLTKEYYLSYFSNNAVANESVINNLDKLVNTYSAKFNVESHINYCLLLAVNDFLVKYVNKDINLKPFEVDLVNNESEVTVNLIEKVKEKRKELNELVNNKDVPEEDLSEKRN